MFNFKQRGELDDLIHIFKWLKSNFFLVKKKQLENIELQDVIGVFANESRLAILLHLSNKKEKISSLAKFLNLNIQDTHRNVNKMINTGILTKDDAGFLRIAPLGKITILLYPSFEFVFKNRNYFLDHTFENVPEKFSQRIGVLNNCKLTKGVVKVLEQWKKIAEEAEKYVKVIASQAPLEAVETTLQRASQGLKINLVLGENTIFPEAYPKLLKKYQIGKLELNGLFETKMIKEIDFCIVLSDKEASISFSRYGGDVDIDQTFFGKEKEFLEWCNDLFEWVWSNGDATGTNLGQKFKIPQI